jgi:hypothetical protein
VDEAEGKSMFPFDSLASLVRSGQALTVAAQRFGMTSWC